MKMSFNILVSPRESLNWVNDDQVVVNSLNSVWSIGHCEFIDTVSLSLENILYL